MNQANKTLFEFLEPCFNTSFSAPSICPPNFDSMDATAFITFFDNFSLPFPVQMSFNSQETDLCTSIGDILRKYFSLGYRHGALDHFLHQCEVSQIAPDKYIFSGSEEPLTISSSENCSSIPQGFNDSILESVEVSH